MNLNDLVTNISAITEKHRLDEDARLAKRLDDIENHLHTLQQYMHDHTVTPEIKKHVEDLYREHQIISAKLNQEGSTIHHRPSAIGEDGPREEEINNLDLKLKTNSYNGDQEGRRADDIKSSLLKSELRNDKAPAPISNWLDLERSFHSEFDDEHD